MHFKQTSSSHSLLHAQTCLDKSSVLTRGQGRATTSHPHYYWLKARLPFLTLSQSVFNKYSQGHEEEVMLVICQRLPFNISLHLQRRTVNVV